MRPHSTTIFVVILGLLALAGCGNNGDSPAPAACTPDSYEPDNKAVQARLLGASAIENHNHCDNPVDWFAFNARAGYVYTIETGALGIKADTVICVSADGDPRIPTACSDDIDFAAGNLASRLTFTPAGSGVHYFTVESVGGMIGPGTEYTLSFTEAYPANTPDLQIPAFNAPASVYPSGTATFSGTVANTGTGASGPFRIGIYVQFSNGATVPAGTVDFTGLGMNSSAGFTLDVVVPPQTPTGMTYSAYAIADDLNSVAEFSESNNQGTPVAGSVLAPPPSDLAARLDSAPASAPSGSLIAITDTVTNMGIGSSGSSMVSLYLSTDSTIDTSDVLVQSRSVPALAAGGTSAATWSALLPLVAPGTYYLGTIADPSNTGNDADRTNNVSAPVAITISAALPADLVAGGVVLSSSTAPAGSQFGVEALVTNSGAGFAGASNVGLYLSTDSVITTGDLLIGILPIQFLAAGDSIRVSGGVALPVVAAGAYYIGVIADYDNLLNESDETNNATVGVPITLTTANLPDLTAGLDAAPAPAAADAGTSFNVTGVVANQGIAAAPDPVAANLYLSTDSTIDTSDLLIGTCFDAATSSSPLPALSTGASVTVSCAGSLPLYLASGTYYLGIVVDPDQRIAEANEGNNASTAVAIAITAAPLPDLTVSAFMPPSAIQPGAPATLSITVTNAGNASTTGAADVAIDIYNTDAQGAALLVSNTTPGAIPILGSGQSATLASTAAAPPLPAGTYYFRARLDSGNAVLESNENNNSSSLVPFTVVSSPLPDLAFAAPPTLGAAAAATGATVAVGIVVTNTGGSGTVNGFRVGVHASASPFVTATDALLCAAVLAPLLPTATAATTLPCTISLAAGSYHIAVIIDDQSLIGEPDEANNYSASIPFTVQ